MGKDTKNLYLTKINKQGKTVFNGSISREGKCVPSETGILQPTPTPNDSDSQIPVIDPETYERLQTLAGKHADAKQDENDEGVTGSQFITVYRGRNAFHWDEPDTDSDLLGELGIHWTRSREIAGHFASGWNIADWTDNEGRGALQLGGHILTGIVDIAHVVPINSSEWYRLAADHSISKDPSGNYSDLEEEITIRMGAPVQVVNVERVLAMIPAPGSPMTAWGPFTFKSIAFNEGYGFA
jgi:hypothetical protein